jgi:protein-S-isoprenylcysteine O-methyltransferase Ste14
MQERIDIKKIVGAGGKIMGATLPFAAAGIILNVLHPQWFAMHAGTAGIVIGAVLLALGIPLWLTSVAQMFTHIPRGKLITTGPFKLLLHPVYTSVALLVLPGLTLVLDTWVGFAIGAILYLVSRIFRVQEEMKLKEIFGEEYFAYRLTVACSWL